MRTKFGFSIVFVILSAIFVSSVSSTIKEKIFVHDRGPLSEVDVKKSARLDVTEQEGYDYIKRAIQEFKESIPTYTSMYFVDLVFELFKNVCIFLLNILVPADEPTTGGVHSTANFSAEPAHVNNAI